MDTAALVRTDDLVRLVDVLEKHKVPVEGAYLIKLTSEDGYEDFVFRVVTPMPSHPFVFKLVELRRDGMLPEIDQRVRVSAERPGSPEATRILGYAAEVGAPVVTIKGAGLHGLFVEDAVVVKWPERLRVPA